MKALNEKNSIYKIIGLLIVIINVICAAISFYFNLKSMGLFGFLIILLIFIVSTFISALPFFALHETLDRVERLEKAAIMSNNEFYVPSEGIQSTTWISKKHEKEQEDYKGFSFDGHIQAPTVKHKK